MTEKILTVVVGFIVATISTSGYAGVALLMAIESGSMGTYQLNTTGTLNVLGNEEVGGGGYADFQQIGGTNKVGGALIIDQGIYTGTYELDGGTLDATSIYIDSNVFTFGTSKFSQSGGVLTGL